MRSDLMASHRTVLNVADAIVTLDDFTRTDPTTLNDDGVAIVELGSYEPDICHTPTHTERRVSFRLLCVWPSVDTDHLVPSRARTFRGFRHQVNTDFRISDNGEHALSLLQRTLHRAD